MTLKDFLETVKTAGKIAGSQKEIAYNIFSEAGITVSENTIDKWITQKDRIPRLNNDSIDNAGFIRYFNRYTKSTWQNIQEKFSEKDEHGLINRNTRNPIIFYKSLLVLFYDVLRLVPVSLRHILPATPPVFGRENELKRIATIFTTSNYAIITGIGGIGKSYTALAYAHSLNQEDGWIIQHIICEASDNLRTSISKLQFDNFSTNAITISENEEENFDNIITNLKKCISPTLIILDNFDHSLTPDERKDFEKLKNCDTIHFLITSRNTLKQDKQHVVHAMPLDDESLLMLYKYYRFEDFTEHKNYFDCQKDILSKLFTFVEKHTLMIALLAKLSERCSLSEANIYELLNDNLSLPSEEINITKDNIPTENSISGILKKIFDISQLTVEEKCIMRYMSLMPLAGVDIDLFEELTLRPRDIIHALANSGWIIKNEETFAIRLHPLVRNVIQKYDNCLSSTRLCLVFCRHVVSFRNRFPTDSHEWKMYDSIYASSLYSYFNIYINIPLNNFFNWYKGLIKKEIRTRLKFNPKSDSKTQLINKLTKCMPKDRFDSHIIKTLISKLNTISENKLTDSLVDRIVDDSVNEFKNIISFLNKPLKELSEGKYSSYKDAYNSVPEILVHISEDTF